MSDPPRPSASQVAALLAASTATTLGNLAQTTVLGLVVYKITNSELDLGFLGLAEFAPAALLVVVAGAVVDRFDARRVAAVGGLTNALVALGLALYLRHPQHASTLPIYALVVAYGCGQAFLSPAMRSLPVAMVEPEGVPWLIARRNVAQEAAMIGGPILGGFLYDVGVWVPMIVVAGLALVGALVAPLIRLLPRHHLERLHAGEDAEGRGGTARRSASVGEMATLRDEEVGHVPEEGIPATEKGLRQAMAGLRFVRRQPILLGAISLDLFAVLLGGATTLLPAIAVQLHTGAIGLGWLRAATGIGAGAMMVLLSFRPVQRRVGHMLFGVVGIFGIWTVVLGVTRSFAVAFISILALSAADAVSMFIRSTLVPLATPPDMRGRVLAVENVFIGASNQLGGFESGALGQLMGTTGSIVFGGLGTLAVAIIWSLVFPPLRRLDRFPSLPAGDSPPADALTADASGVEGRT